MLLTALPQLNLKVDEPIDMLPKSRKALSIQEIAALARSSLNGISQVVKDHVTKPTAMAQGRVAHLIEWKGWSKPLDPLSATLQSHFNSYSHLSEGEQEARFAAGVAEQFAIAEAKLRAWNSVDEEDVDEDCSEDDLLQNNELTTTSQNSDGVLSIQECPAPYQAETDSVHVPPSGSPLCSLGTNPTCLQEPCLNQMNCDGQAEGAPLQELQLPTEVDRGLGESYKPNRHLLWSRGDSCYHSTSYSESGLSPEEEEGLEEGEDNVFREVIRWYSVCRSISDTSGAVSFDDEEEEVEEASRQ
ncbi:protein FAM131A isoform X2 [Brachyhypopomus gauderio]|uniref:protein FAM131A isoform X2 n=1 Tax=Brachyhypopomus gauderio TaxID=698409 RepID=UPI004041FEF6